WHESGEAVREHLGTFRLLEEKTPPGIIDKFGWCTWDAFYRKPHPEGVWEGVKGLVEGGCPPGLVIIDDGWQTVCHDDKPLRDQDGTYEHDTLDRESHKHYRLVAFEENSKFMNYKNKNKLIRLKKADGEQASEEPMKGMGALVKDIKESFKSIEYVYVWHGLCGHWGGIRPNVLRMPTSRVIMPKRSPALQMNMLDLAIDEMEKYGVGLVMSESVHELFEGLHSHLESVGIDRVKVDYIHFLEMVSEDYDGQVELAKAYYMALTALVKNKFRREWAISGGPIYISDNVGAHDFQLLKSLVLPDGSILRCEYYALPTGDCLFKDPWRDGKTVLKIWNLNKAKKMVLLKASEHIEISLEPFTYEIFTVSLVQNLVERNESVHFAAIGLVNMLNTGGAIQSLSADDATNLVQIGVKGTGEFRVFASKRPKICRINSDDVSFRISDQVTTYKSG
ncbi:hypothetical protein IFM89_005106, partial [Coptis chinensis]